MKDNQTKKVTKQIKKTNKGGQIKSKANRLKLKKNEEDHGIIYVGHLPYGFLEEGIQQYFTQFGELQGVKVYRSKKTNRSMGYGFVKFANKEVAEIAASTMNGYWMGEKKLVCHLLPADQPDPFKYKYGSQKLPNIKWGQKFIKESNQDKSDEKIVKQLKTLIENEELKRKLLKEAGVDYKYIGYKEILG